MTAAWVVYVLAVGTLLTVGAVVLASACRQLGWSTRFSFAGALAGILAFAVVAPRPAALDVKAPVRVVSATAPAVRAATEPTLIERLRAARAVVATEASALSEAMQRRVSPTVQRVVLVGWLVASASLLLLFVLVNRRFATARRSWPSQSLHGIAVRVAPRLGPAVLGFLRAEIVVPQDR